VSRFRFVDDHRDVYDVKRLCRAVEISRSGYYAWKGRCPSPRAVADAELLARIRQVHRDSRRTYGAPRVHGVLARMGCRVGRKRVARLMRAHGLVGAHNRKKWRGHRPEVAPAPDRLHRNFTAHRPNSRWVADVTEFPTGEGKLFLAGIRDLCHRGLVGWAMSEHNDHELVVDALVMALGRCTADVDGLVHHSDKGSPYTSLDFCAAADVAGLTVSFGSTGDCFDNSAMETFWSVLKREIAWIRGSIFFPTRRDARLYLFEFIEVFYNRQRHQAGLTFMTPVEYASTFTASSPKPRVHQTG
jgi:transposase InsO family protein